MNPKQQRFVDEYLLDLNAKQAAIRAGYSARTAKQIANRLVAEPEIQEAISVAKAARSERTQINADWLLRRLADEVEADVADLYNKNGGLKPVHDWPEVWRRGLVAGLDIEEIRSGDVTVGQIRKLKLSDRIKRLELIGKHVDVQAFKDQVENTGGITVTIVGKDADL